MEMAEEMSGDLISSFASDCRTRGLGEPTIIQYCSKVAKLQAFFQVRGKTLQQADRLDIRDYVESLRVQGLKTQTIRIQLAALASFYGWLVFEGRAMANPVLEVRRRLTSYKAAGEAETHQLISVEEAAALVESIVHIRDKALMLLLLKTGIRRGELISLDVDRINWQNQSLTLKLTKKRSNRTVFFDDEAAYYLKRWLEIRGMRRGADGPALFLSHQGGRLQEGAIDRLIRKAAVRVGLHDESSESLDQHFSAHSCRHWMTTHLLRSGMKREYVQWLRGDAIKEAVDIYFHVNSEDVRKQYLAHIPQLGV